MDSERWQKINELFHAAIECDATERISFLKQACADDENLFKEVERLILAHGDAGDFIQKPVFIEAVELLEDDAENSKTIGRQFGAYKLVREIGRGGMGAVYLAERADSQFEKRVAVKLIKRGMDTDAVLQRFRHERQILASLEHPNIARLLDGGTTGDGLPYFVMEYIEGLPITKYADTHRLSLKQRLELFRKVCAAVSYAHQRLVIHRDLKPSNILVTDEGEPKLLDFGIAKLMNPERGGLETNQTATGLRLMTPEYASPEQIQGSPVTTLTDVYSLGVILYEILSGHLPYRFKDYSPLELAQKISDEEPPKPSDPMNETRGRGNAETRRYDDTKKNPKSEIRNPKSLRGDLDNIVLKAMRKEPEQRYASVGQFSEDIRRHLVGLPVIARPVTFSYRLAKFVQRNRAAVGAAAIIFLLLIGGIITTTWQAVRAQQQEQLAKMEKARAEKRFNDVRKLARSVLFDYHDAIKDLPGSTPVRAKLVKDALEYLDSLAAEASSDASLQLELATAYERIGDVQGGTMKANLGDTSGSIESYRKALAILQSLAASDSQNTETRYQTAACSRKLGILLWETGDAKGSLDESRKALILFQELVSEKPADSNLSFELGATFNRIGLILKEQGDYPGSLESYQKELEIYQSLPASERESEKTRQAISRAYQHLTTTLLSNGDTGKALEINRRGVEMSQALSNDFPLNAEYRRAFASSLYWEGRVLERMDRPAEALESYQKSLDIAEKLLLSDPNNESYRHSLGHSLIRAGDMQVKLDKAEESITDYRRAISIFSEDFKTDPTNLWKRSNVIRTRQRLCRTLAKMGTPESVETECAKAFSLMEETSLDPTNAQDRNLFADAYSDIGKAYSTLALRRKDNPTEVRKYWSAAREMYQRSLQIWQDMRNRGILNKADADRPEIVAREIERCAAALK